MKDIFIGLDGGGTKTLTIAVDAEGKELGRFQSGCSNFNSVGDEKSREAVLSGIDSVIEQAGGLANVNVGGICLGMSGVGRDEDKNKVKSWFDVHLPQAPIQLNNDAVVALAAGTKGKLFGIVVISGTGFIVTGFDEQGRSSRSGGWGPLLDDKGAGYYIGASVCAAVCRAHDRTGPQTTLTAELMQTLNLTRIDEIVPWAYDPNNQNWQRWAALAPLATKCAEQGDETALRILEEVAQCISETVESVIIKLSFNTSQPIPVVLAGGNIERDCLLSQKIKSKLISKYTTIQFAFPEVESAMGAALLALNTAKSNPLASSQP